MSRFTAWLRRQLSRRGEIIRGVSILAGGAGLRQAIVLLAAPILTRLFAPAQFGVLAVFTSILAIGGIAASLAYQLAIPLPETDEEAVNLLALSLSLLTIFALGLWAALVLDRDAIQTWLDLKDGGSLFVLIGPALWVAGCYQCLSYWASRKGRFGALARTKVMQGMAQDGVQVAGGVLGWGTPVLLAGYAIGQSIGISGLLRASPVPWARVTWGKVRKAAINYSQFPRFSVFAGLANTGGLQVPPLLISHIFGAVTAGSFGLTVRVLALPSALVGQAVAQVYYPAAASRVNKGEEIAGLTKALALALLAAGATLFIPFILLGPGLFVGLFGSQWGEAGDFSRPMAVWAAISLVSSPLSVLILVRGKQLPAMAITASEAALRIAAIWWGGRGGTAQTAVEAYALIGVISSAASITWVLYMAGVHVIDFLRSSVPLLVAIAVAIGLWRATEDHVSALIVGMGVLAVMACGAWVTIGRISLNGLH